VLELTAHSAVTSRYHVIACCVGVRVQASCSATAHVLWCAHVPCCGCSLQPRLSDAAARPPKCERTWHSSSRRSTACSQLRADPTASNRSGSALRDGEVTGMGGAGKRKSVARNSVGGLVMVKLRGHPRRQALLRCASIRIRPG